MGFKEQLNEFYKNLDDRANHIREILLKNGFKTEKNYYNGHYYNKDSAGNLFKDYYPMTLIELFRLFDI